MLSYNLTDIEYWNSLVKPCKEVDVTAEKGDLVIEIGGIVYLLQRKNDMNNVVCFRHKKTKMSTLKSFYAYRQWLVSRCIQYIRVEGNTKRYKFLTKLNPCSEYSVIQDTEEKDRNIFYLKLF